jgi:hypothetical protein
VGASRKLLRLCQTGRIWISLERMEINKLNLSIAGREGQWVVRRRGSRIF